MKSKIPFKYRVKWFFRGFLNPLNPPPITIKEVKKVADEIIKSEISKQDKKILKE